MAVGYPVGQLRYKKFPSVQKVLSYGALIEKYEKASLFYFLFFLADDNTLLGRHSTPHEVGDISQGHTCYRMWIVSHAALCMDTLVCLLEGTTTGSVLLLKKKEK